MLRAEPPVLRRPTYSAITFGGLPAAWITVAASINCTITSRPWFSDRDHLQILRIDPRGSVVRAIVTGPQIGQLGAKLALRPFSDRCKRARHRPIVRAEKLDHIRRRERITEFVEVAGAFEARDPGPQAFANGRLVAPQHRRWHTRGRNVSGDGLKHLPHKAGT